MSFVLPGPGEVRITVFGHNRGESIVIHLGSGRWMIVDSLRGTWDGGDSRQPAALGYLGAMGVDVAKAVDAVVLTHLHADHSDGIEMIVKECRSARFYLPSAIPDEGWRRILRELADEADHSTKSQMREIGTAFRLAVDVGRFSSAGATSHIGTSGSVHALAPVSAAQVSAREATGAGEVAHVSKLMRQNATSVVLWIQAGNGAALLCADMDNHNELGWPAVLREHEGITWIGRAGFVKIAHHGSKASQHPEVFDRWTDAPLGVLTPNRLGRVNLPKEDDLPDLFPLTQSLWLAGRPSGIPVMTSKDTAIPTDLWWVEATCDPETGTWTASARDHASQLLHEAES